MIRLGQRIRTISSSMLRVCLEINLSDRLRVHTLKSLITREEYLIVRKINNGSQEMRGEVSVMTKV